MLAVSSRLRVLSPCVHERGDVSSHCPAATSPALLSLEDRSVTSLKPEAEGQPSCDLGTSITHICVLVKPFWSLSVDLPHTGLSQTDSGAASTQETLPPVLFYTPFYFSPRNTLGPCIFIQESGGGYATAHTS